MSYISLPKKSKYLSISNYLLMREAERRGWKTKIMDYERNFIALFPDDDPKNVILLQRTTSIINTSIGFIIAKDKTLTYVLANHIGMAMPESIIYNPDRPNFSNEITEFIKRHGQIVVKPSDCSRGIGVTTNVTDIQSFDTAVKQAKKYSSSITIQSYVPGNDYRILVLNGRVIAATWRRPAFVIGDGVRTIRQLIDLRNLHPWRLVQQDQPLTCIDLDEVRDYIGIDKLDTIPEKGCEVQLVGVANISRGGESRDVTELLHPTICSLAVQITNAAQLSLCGVDMIIQGDITKPNRQGCNGTLIEVNGSPNIGMHHFPSDGGFARNVSAAILDEIIASRRLRHCEQMDYDKSYFASIVTNADEFLELSNGEKEYYANNLI